jgi:hypothetical protein
MPYKDSVQRYESQKKHRDKNHNLMWELLTNSECKDCKINDPRVLEFDHLPIYEKKFDISRAVGGSTRSWSSILTEIQKCDIVCSNCHKIRTMERGNYKRHKSFIG